MHREDQRDGRWWLRRLRAGFRIWSAFHDFTWLVIGHRKEMPQQVSQRGHPGDYFIHLQDYTETTRLPPPPQIKVGELVSVTWL